MKVRKWQVPEKHAIWIVPALASAVAVALSLVFAPLSFPWFAWGALGYFAIVTGWREFIVVDSAPETNSRTFWTRSNRAIATGWIVAISIWILGFLEIISMRDLILGLAAMFVLIMLWRTNGRWRRMRREVPVTGNPLAPNQRSPVPLAPWSPQSSRLLQWEISTLTCDAQSRVRRHSQGVKLKS